MNLECCERCRFSSIRGEQLQCRRFPPTVFADDNNYFTVFPRVTNPNWCGEYKPANPQEEVS